MNRFRKTLSYITIMVAIFVTVLSITNVVSGEVIRSLNLAVMSLIAILLTELVGLLPSTQLEPSISTLLEPESNLEELRQLILTSRRIKAWGTTFSTHIPMLQGGLRKAVVNLGLEIRFLLIKPHSCAVEMAELRDRNSNGRLNETLVRNLDILLDIGENRTFNKKIDAP